MKLANGIVLVSLVFLSSCYSTQEVAESWNGATKQQVIMQMGPPHKTASDGSNGEIYIYNKTVSKPPQTIARPESQGGNFQVPGWTKTQVIMFYFDSNGRVYHYKRTTQ